MLGWRERLVVNFSWASVSVRGTIPTPRLARRLLRVQEVSPLASLKFPDSWRGNRPVRFGTLQKISNDAHVRQTNRTECLPNGRYSERRTFLVMWRVEAIGQCTGRNRKVYCEAMREQSTLEPSESTFAGTKSEETGG